MVNFVEKPVKFGLYAYVHNMNVGVLKSFRKAVKGLLITSQFQKEENGKVVRYLRLLNGRVIPASVAYKITMSDYEFL